MTGADAIVHVHALNAVVAGHHWPKGVVLKDVETLKGIGRLAHDDEVVIPVIENSQDMTELGDRFEAVYDPPHARRDRRQPRDLHRGRPPCTGRATSPSAWSGCWPTGSPSADPHPLTAAAPLTCRLADLPA